MFLNEPNQLKGKPKDHCLRPQASTLQYMESHSTCCEKRGEMLRSRAFAGTKLSKCCLLQHEEPISLFKVRHGN